MNSHATMLCAFSERTKTIIGDGIRSGLAGTFVGATLGGAITAGSYYVAENSCWKRIALSYNCGYEPFDFDIIDCSNTYNIDVSKNEARNACGEEGSSWAKYIASIAIPVGALSGFALGFFAGAKRSWNSPLDVIDAFDEPLVQNQI